MTTYDILIVGGGQGGAQAAMTLRQLEFPGSVAIVGDESDPPYDRPPLSKEYLSGEKPFERLIFRTTEAWSEKGVDLLLGRRVVAVDPGAHTVTLEDGEGIGYGRLIWAAGGQPRRLSCGGADLSGVHSVRSRTDVDRLIAELPSAREVVVIGGGFIGLEAAAVLSKFGKHITVVEAEDRVLARVAGEPLSRFYEAEHRAHGVDLRMGASVDVIVGKNGRTAGVHLANGEVLPAQMVIVGIGIVPAVAPLLAAGAAGASGVQVDEYCRTSLPDIFAIGDCAEHANSFAAGALIRLESVQNANDQAAVAARTLCGRGEPHRSPPWFWSNQFDLKLQTVGLSRGFDDLVVRGDPAARSFSVIYLAKGRVIALDCVNAVRDYSHGKVLVMAGACAESAVLADTTIPLKALL